MRERTGQIFQNLNSGKWIARVCYKNSNGKRTAVQRSANSKTEARNHLKNLLEKLTSGGRRLFEIEKLTFNSLADHYESHYAIPARFIDGRKVEGMRNLGRVKGFLKIFRAYFGETKLKEITYGDILAFRNSRLKVQTHYKKVRNIATMNRELSCLRRVFNIAIRQDWIHKNPVTAGEPLIDVSAERRRERILTFEEESNLLNACHGKREHLRSLIICLLDTGARRGETLKLKFEDLDFVKRLITYQALNTKTLKSRQVAMTNRVYSELTKLWKLSDGNKDAPVFNIKCFRHSFETACREAGIETGRPFGITPHSLRHTAATRLVKGNMSIQMVGRILSHQNPQTTYRYLTANDETLYQAASILDAVSKGSE